MPKEKINLLPQEEFEKKPIWKILTWTLSVGRWIVTFTELIVILAFLSRFWLDRQISDLYDQIKQKQTIIQSSSDFEHEFRFLQKRLSEIKNLEKKQAQVSSIFAKIARITPVDVVFSSFVFNEQGVKISGTAISEEGLGSFLFGLTNSPDFTDVTLANITKKSGEEAGIRFTLTAKLATGGKGNAI